MDLQCVNKTEALWSGPLWTHTAPLLVINEQLSPSPLMTVNDAVGELSTVQYEEDTEEPWEFYVTSCTRFVWVHRQIADKQTVNHYEVSLEEKHGCHVYMQGACAAFQTSKVVQHHRPLHYNFFFF